jgi:hypothetical protein
MSMCTPAMNTFLALALCSAIVACSSATDSPRSGGKGGDSAGGEAGGGQGGGTDNTGVGGLNEGGSSVANGGVAGSTAASGGQGGSKTGGTSGSTGGTPGTGGQPAGPGPLFSHDFEADATGKAPVGTLWSGDGGGKAKVETGMAYSGTKALKVVSSSGDGMVTIRSGQFLPAPRTTAYVRMMVYMENVSPGGHWDVLANHGLMKGDGMTISGFLSLGGFGDTALKMQYFGDVTAGGKGRSDCTKSTPMPLPEKVWTCVEMKADANDVLNYGVKVNGKDQQSMSFPSYASSAVCVPEWNVTAGVWFLPEVQFTKIGYRHVNEQKEPVTVYIDDVAIDTKPIGCPTKKP